MLKRLKILGVAAATAVLMAVPAQALPVIDFSSGVAGTGGTIQWVGGDLIGTDIPMGVATVHDTPINSGVFLMTGSAPGSGGGSYADLDFDTGSGSNSITINGCIADLGIGTVVGGSCIAPVTLMSGSFLGFNQGAAQFGLVAALGDDIKNADLMAALGIDPSLPWNFFGFSIPTDPLTQGGPPQEALVTGFRNAVAPEPATMVLLGTGLLAAFRARRRMV